jgi:outer membrane protein OmpA-like peptidoglycan-associated protein
MNNKLMLLILCPTGGTALAQTQQPAADQPEMTVLKSTFIPGEKTIFFDDFTDMSADDAPPHFKVRGAAPALMAGSGFRQLTVGARGSLFPNLTALPKNFTYEAEIKAEGKGRAIANLMLLSKGKQILHWTMSAMPNVMDLVVSLRAPYQELGRKRLTVNWNEPVRVDMPPIDSVEIAHDFYGAGTTIGYRTMRIAESAPDFSQMIGSSGRYITHGILFDTDSDRLKPESAPVIQSIARGLETNPNLRLRIEGHTDSVGNAAHNLELSKRRAAAVKAVLETQFKVDGARLAIDGFGSAKPIDSNDTPQGRAQNRRVELVKL